MVKKVRQHNEWFRPTLIKELYADVTRPPKLIEAILQNSPEGNLTREILEKPYRSLVGVTSARKKCVTCDRKLPEGEFIWTWGEYRNAWFRVVAKFCVNCFDDVVKNKLLKHANDCGCQINLIVQGKFGVSAPEWLSIPELDKECSAE